MLLVSVRHFAWACVQSRLQEARFSWNCKARNISGKFQAPKQRKGNVLLQCQPCCFGSETPMPGQLFLKGHTKVDVLLIDTGWRDVRHLLDSSRLIAPGYLEAGESTNGMSMKALPQHWRRLVASGARPFGRSQRQ